MQRRSRDHLCLSGPTLGMGKGKRVRVTKNMQLCPFRLTNNLSNLLPGPIRPPPLYRAHRHLGGYSIVESQSTQGGEVKSVYFTTG